MLHLNLLRDQILFYISIICSLIHVFSFFYFVDDSFHGYAALYYDSGIIKYEGNYNMDIIEGKWIVYALDGEILAEYIFDNGELL